MHMPMSIGEDFISFSVIKLLQLHARVAVCLGKLEEGQIWSRENENANSVANLCLHMAGNLQQWILHGVFEQEDTRQRDAEFAIRGGHTRNEIARHLRGTVEEACTLLRALPPERLTEAVTPQSYEVTVLEAIYHVVEHFAQHTGQIVFFTKAQTGEDLGFYRHLKNANPPPPSSEKP